MRIGILGAARIAGAAVVEPARATGDQLVAVAARDPRRAEAFAAEHGVEKALAAYDDVLADPDVEVVYNALPNALHGPWNLRAIAAGKHVLSEKPFASNAPEARAVRAAAHAAGLTVVEAFHHVHHPVAQRLRELTTSGELGELRRIETHFRMPAPADDDPRWSLTLAGGAVMDIGCYTLHLQRFLGSSPSVVVARAGLRAGKPRVDEWLEAELLHTGGVTGLAHCHMAAPELRITCRLIGSRGTALAANVVLPQLDDRIVVAVDGQERTEHLGRRSTYTYQLEALGAHLRGERAFPLDLDDAVANAELIDAAYTAAGPGPRPSL